MQDRYKRKIDYMRVSVTDRCNLRCRYCMPERIESVEMKELLTYEEITNVVRAAQKLGISRIKITGGEPLVRRGIDTLVNMLKCIPGIEEVTITTNGVLLYDQLDDLVRSGIDGINISLDTLDSDRYRQITGFDKLEDVRSGIEAALKYGIPIKINAVSLKSDDVDDLIGLTKDRDIDVRFIEMMPIGMGKGFPGIPHDELIPMINDRYGQLQPDNARHGNGPAEYYRISGFRGCIGFISAIHKKFCDSCNRIRLTSQGFLKSCLCYDTGVDVKETLRSGKPEQEIFSRLGSDIEQCIFLKPDSHSFLQGEKISEKHAMSSIGG